MSTFKAKQLIRDNLNIPTLPEVLMRVGQLIEDPESGTHEIGEVVSRDAPLAAKVLRIANSAFYGLRERCLSAEQACSVLGIRVLRNVVMQAAVIQQFDHLRSFEGFDLDEIWRHSILTAQTSAFLAGRSQGEFELSPEEFHICGLLHDIGKVVMLDSMGLPYLELTMESKQGGRPLQHLETETYGFNHSDVGVMLANRWDLPPAAVAAIQYHHGPREKVAEDPVVALIANANLITHRVAAGEGEAALGTLDEQTTAILSLDPEKVPEVVEYAASALSSIEI